MLDLVFFTPCTSDADKKRVEELYEKIMKSVYHNELVGKTIFFNNIANKREFHILIEDNNNSNLSLEIDIDTIYERKREDKRH